MKTYNDSIYIQYLLENVQRVQSFVNFKLYLWITLQRLVFFFKKSLNYISILFKIQDRKDIWSECHIKFPTSTLKWGTFKSIEILIWINTINQVLCAVWLCFELSVKWFWHFSTPRIAIRKSEKCYKTIGSMYCYVQKLTVLQEVHHWLRHWVDIPVKFLEFFLISFNKHINIFLSTQKGRWKKWWYSTIAECLYEAFVFFCEYLYCKPLYSNRLNAIGVTQQFLCVAVSIEISVNAIWWIRFECLISHYYEKKGYQIFEWQIRN